jgi:hypothetical protein
MDVTKKDEMAKLEAKFDALNETIISAEKNLERENNDLISKLRD